MNLIATLLPPFLRLLTRVTEQQEVLILKKGRRLTPHQRANAKKAGVTRPERIRVLVVTAVPPPKGLLLSTVAKLVGASGPDVAGATYGYGIMIREDCGKYQENRELYLHEFVHVAQMEKAGSLRAFLSEYLKECIIPGYPHGRLEKQADRHAANIIRSS